MSPDSIQQGFHRNLPGAKGRVALSWFASLALALLTILAGCQSPSAVNAPAGRATQVGKAAPASDEPGTYTIEDGDVLQISFPSTKNLDTKQQVRRDGKVSLAMVGEVKAAGLTPSELEKELARLYSPQLVSNQVTVTVVSSSYAVFVTGAVLKPGKIQADHRLTALEAIMDAGGFDTTKANMKAVKVIRQVNGETQYFTLNLQLVLDGKPSQPFYLKHSDIVYVPEKFSWF